MVTNYEELAGLVETRISRETKLRVSIYNNSLAGMDDNDGNDPWSTVCEEHGWISSHRTLKLARLHLANPTGWCEVCAGTEKES